MKFFKKHKQREKGITLFVAVLVASVALLFSFAVSDIALREVLLAQTGKDSQEAFYAANTGVECALFWDLKFGSFEPEPDGADVICNGRTGEAVVQTIFGGGTETWTLTGASDLEFSMSDDDDENEPCFKIDSVIKEVERDEEDNIVSIETEIIVKGYNTCNTSSPRRLERALRVAY